MPKFHLDHAQPLLPTVNLVISGTPLRVEVARSLSQIATGFMFRDPPGPEDGMLFVYARPGPRAYYMLNVGFDLSVAFLDAEGVVDELLLLKARDANLRPSRSDRIQFAIETVPEFFLRGDLDVGARATIAGAGLREYFFPGAAEGSAR